MKALSSLFHFKQSGRIEQKETTQNPSELTRFKVIEEYRGNSRMSPREFIANFEDAIINGMFRSSLGFNDEKVVSVFLEQLISVCKTRFGVNSRGIHYLGQELIPFIIAAKLTEDKLCRESVLSVLTKNDYIISLSESLKGESKSLKSKSVSEEKVDHLLTEMLANYGETLDPEVMRIKIKNLLDSIGSNRNVSR